MSISGMTDDKPLTSRIIRASYIDEFKCNVKGSAESVTGSYEDSIQVRYCPFCGKRIKSVFKHNGIIPENSCTVCFK